MVQIWRCFRADQQTSLIARTMQDHYDQWRNAENQEVAWSVECRDIKHSAVHAQNCRDQGVDFQPLVVETFGGWDSDALKFLKEIARIDARRWGKDETKPLRSNNFSSAFPFLCKGVMQPFSSNVTSNQQTRRIKSLSFNNVEVILFHFSSISWQFPPRGFPFCYFY